MPPPEPHQSGVSVREAAAILGTSPSDVLRRIRRGELNAERFERPGGTYYRVYLPTPEPHQPIESEAAPEPRQDTSAATARLVDQLVDLIERQAILHDRIAALEREAGQAVSDATHARDAAQIERERRLEAEAEAVTLRKRVEFLQRPFWRRWFGAD